MISTMPHLVINLANFEKTLFLKGSVSFANCIFEEGDPNFNSAIFYDGNVSFYNTNFVKGTKNIKNTRWGKGFKNFQYSFWGNGEALFANSIFDDGDIWFVNTTFAEGELSFKIAQLGIGKLYFKFSIFENTRMNFERIEYKNGIIDFSKTEINKGKINFNKSTFNIATIDFSESEINNVKFTFKNVYFKEGLFSFEDSILKETSLVLNKSIFKDVLLLFRNAHINELSLNACQINNYCDLRLKYCNNLDLSEVFLKDIVDISNEKYPTAIKSLNVFGTRLTGKMFISWSKNNVYPLIQNSTTHNKQKAWQYNLLKQNFSIIRQYNDEDMAYVAFKREELKAKQQQIKTLPTIKKIITWLSIYFEKIVFDKMGLYATSPVRVFTSVLVLWFVFGLIFILFDWLRIGKTWSSVGNHDQISVIAQSFYHSAITFFTIGYGEVFPQGASRIISAIEGFFGVFMMSYFTVAFVRKILR